MQLRCTGVADLNYCLTQRLIAHQCLAQHSTQGTHSRAIALHRRSLPEPLPATVVLAIRFCRSRLQDLVEYPHVWPFQALYESPGAAYLMRQHLAANLYDRLSTRPFMSNIEKVPYTYRPDGLGSGWRG